MPSRIIKIIRKYLPVLGDLVPDHLHQWALHSGHPQLAELALGVKEAIQKNLEVLYLDVRDHGIGQ